MKCAIVVKLSIIIVAHTVFIYDIRLLCLKVLPIGTNGGKSI